MAGIKDRRLYIAALGVAIGALALDRVVLSGGALGPGAAAAASPDASEADLALQGPQFEPEPDTTAQLAGKLKELERERDLDLSKVRDAFWLDGVSKAPDAPQLEGDDAVIAAFRKGHALRAVVTGPQGGFVIAGQDRLEIGQWVEVTVAGRAERFTLAEVIVNAAGRRAVFNFNGRAVELTMDARNVAGTGG